MSLRNFLNFKSAIHLRTICLCYQQKYYSSKAPKVGLVKEIDPETGQVRKKKTPMIPKITLLSGDSINVVTLQEAENISKRRDLKLVKIVDLDTKTQRPIYKLMTGPEYFAEDLKQREKRKIERQNDTSIKGEKVAMINSRISEHDLETQLKKILKWTSKRYEVRMVISGNSGGMHGAEKVSSSIEDFVKKEGNAMKVVQKQKKGNEVRLLIRPGETDKSDGNKSSL